MVTWIIECFTFNCFASIPAKRFNCWSSVTATNESTSEIFSPLKNSISEASELSTIVLSSSLAISVAFSFDFSINLTDISSSSIEETILPILLAPAIITLFESEFFTPSVSSNELRFFDLTKKKT